MPKTEWVFTVQDTTALDLPALFGPAPAHVNVIQETGVARHHLGGRRLILDPYSVPQPLATSGIDAARLTDQVRQMCRTWVASASSDATSLVADKTVAALRPTNARELVRWLRQEPDREAIDRDLQAVAAAEFGRAMILTAVALAQAPSRFSTYRSPAVGWFDKLDMLSRLAPGWNRHGAPAPSQKAIRAARQFVEAMIRDDQPPTRVAASAVGGVGVTREVKGRMLYAEFYNDGRVCALLTSDGGEETVRDVVPDSRGFTHLLNEAKAYLNA